MSIKVYGMEELQFLIRQTGARASRGVIDKMREQATEARDLARKMAPVDEGNLEEAIKVEEVAGGRDELGRFVRNSIQLYVDGDMVLPENPNRTVGDYAMEIHEHQTPYGPIPLGEKSQQKQEGQSEVVGGKFLERAVEEKLEGRTGELQDVVNDLV